MYSKKYNSEFEKIQNTNDFQNNRNNSEIEEISISSTEIEIPSKKPNEHKNL